MNMHPDVYLFTPTVQVHQHYRVSCTRFNSMCRISLNLLDEINQRSMIGRFCSDFGWACRLRAYARDDVSNTTITGYII